ncbi:MAG: VWA domain-containing protein [Bacteroidales bacterium]|nr:VWA domain-containing protein [Bacteroidales bacterium]
MKSIKQVVVLFLIFSVSSCYLLKKQSDYYGMTVDSSKKIVFLVDVSGSMEGKAETDLEGNIIDNATNYAGNKVADKVGGVGGKIIRNQTSNQLTKLGKAKKELIPTIRGLSEDTYFTIITFENDVKMWRKNLVQATTANKNLAINFLNSLESGGGTNIHDALETAFELAGDAIKESTVLGVETIFVLSDGSPSAGKITDQQGIIDAVETWNSLEKVVINTIGLGDDKDVDFLTNLAVKNKGTYIDK